MKLHTFQVPDLPVMVAVVEDDFGWFGVGISVSTRGKYEPERATDIAIRDARRKYLLTSERRKAREALYGSAPDVPDSYLDSRNAEHRLALGGFHALDP